MPIEFDCPSCHLRYRVKDELAGKGAKCGKCGHRMRIPQAESANAVPKSVAQPTSKPSSSATRPAARPANAAATSRPSSTRPAPVDDDIGSWLNDDLETSQPVVASAGSAGAACPSCGTALPAGAVLCVGCGYDSRTGAKHETRHEIEPAAAAKKKQGSKVGSAASLLRGTVFSFLAAMLGAAVWAALAFFTEREFGIIAWALGGLVGFGMALGHEDEDGTTAGIIAAFMSLVGIVAAKVFIIVIVIAAFVSEVAQQADPVEMKRAVLAPAVANEKLQAQGVDLAAVSEEQWEQAHADAKAELATLSDEELDARFEAMAAAGEDADEGSAIDPDAGEALADAGDSMPEGGVDEPELDLDAAEDVAVADEPGAVAMFFKLMFSPIDGLFILLAFFTAYKVGSGQMSD